jgi:hypothetical protein
MLNAYSHKESLCCKFYALIMKKIMQNAANPIIAGDADMAMTFYS